MKTSLITKPTILLIGDLPLASEVFKLFLKQKDEVDIIGVLVQHPGKKFFNDPFEEERNLFEVATSHSIPVYYSVEEVLSCFKTQSIDFGVSCRASIIYKQDFINLFKSYFINMHGGLLPERAGVNVACHCIIEGDEIGGATLHLIERKVDAGSIIDRYTFRLTNNDTAFSVYQKTQLCLIKMIENNLYAIINNKLSPKPQSLCQPIYEPKYFKKCDLPIIKKVKISDSLNYIEKVVRGCDFPGHEPAYMEFEDKKIYLTTQNFFDSPK